MSVAVSPRNFDTGDLTTVVRQLNSGQNIYKRERNARIGYIDTQYRLAAVLGALRSLSYERSEMFHQEGSYLYSGWEYRYDMTGVSDCPLNSTERDTRAREYFYKNALNTRVWDLGVALAEARQTIGLVASTAARIASSYRNLRKGRINDAFSALGVRSGQRIPYHLRGLGSGSTAAKHRKSLERRYRNSSNLADFSANAWLEMRYGWTPLLYDAHSAGEALGYFFERSPPTVNINGVYEYEGGIIPASPQMLLETGYSKEVVRYDMFFQLSDENLSTLSKLGLNNPAEIAWELTPFSFVVDWFLPVGDWIKSFSALSGLKYVQGTKTTYRVQKYHISAFAPGQEPNGFLNGAPAEEDSFWMDRVSATPPSVPLPRFSLYERLNGQRLTDALALLTKVFGR